MSASATEDDAENVSLIKAYPRDVIIQYVYKPTIVDHPILTGVMLIFITAVHPLICDFSPPQTATCGRVFRSITIAIGGFPLCLVIYLLVKLYLLRCASHREGQVELV